MAKISLDPLRDIDGYVAAALADSESGMLLVADGDAINLEVAAAGNTEVLRAKRKVANALKLNDTIEDVLISLTKQYHLIRPLESNQNLFLYVVLDRSKSNLAMARHELRSFEMTLDFSCSLMAARGPSPAAGSLLFYCRFLHAPRCKDSGTG